MNFRSHRMILIVCLEIGLLFLAITGCFPDPTRKAIVRTVAFRDLTGAKILFRDARVKYYGTSSIRWTSQEKIVLEEYFISPPVVNLWIGDPVTGKIDPVVSDKINGLDPAVSPDGQYLAYNVCPMGCTGVQIASLNPSFTPKKWIDLEGNALAWSPDGSQLAMMNIDVENDCIEIYFYTLQTDHLELIYTFPREGRNYTFFIDTDNMAWSPDGKYLAFSLESTVGKSQADVYLFSIADKSLQAVTTNPTLYEGYPSWSPEGVLMYVSAPSGAMQIQEGTLAFYDVQRKCTKMVTTARGIKNPQWSPDGKEIAFVAEDDHKKFWVYSLPVASLGIDVTRPDAVCSPSPTPTK